MIPDQAPQPVGNRPEAVRKIQPPCAALDPHTMPAVIAHRRDAPTPSPPGHPAACCWACRCWRCWRRPPRAHAQHQVRRAFPAGRCAARCWCSISRRVRPEQRAARWPGRTSGKEQQPAGDGAALTGRRLTVNYTVRSPVPAAQCCARCRGSRADGSRLLAARSRKPRYRLDPAAQVWSRRSAWTRPADAQRPTVARPTTFHRP